MSGQPVILLALMLATGTSAFAQPRPPPCETGARRIELGMESPGQVPELCISPGVSTTLLFHNAELLQESVAVEGAERFTVVDMGRTLLRLEPSERVMPGERLRLTVRFKDGAAPVGASFWLAVWPGQAEQWVEVYRQKRPVESFLQQLVEKDAQLRHCHADNARLHAERQSPGGLTGLLATMLMNEDGVATKSLTKSMDWHPLDAVRVRNATSYRSERRVAMRLVLKPAEARSPWRAARVELMGPDHHSLPLLPSWQFEILEPDGPVQHLVIEAEATEATTRGSFTLKVWTEDGTESITFTGVTFP